MSPQRLLNYMHMLEVSRPMAPDMRRIVISEAASLLLALRSGDPSRIKEAKAEAVRVLEMWGIAP